ncbi:hypothetical protein RHMOL_Rhmol03G0013200 [Rhododendron molle]|uniref:Uncharacterized protein n=1 Tax=Rhododendron molle TaxID=49168 RepID=A0ACC0P934_RHOML|nr:hypothetical protein RHMOL_Rhmol03G0013200 [Rhododendron molle]
MFYSLIPEQNGRTIYFRAARSSALAIDFYCIPVDDDDDSPQLSYGAPLKHIVPFYCSTNISGSSSFAAVDKSMYCVGGHKTNGRGEETSTIYRFDTTGDNSGSWFRNSFDMCCPRVAPSTVVMDGKLFKHRHSALPDRNQILVACTHANFAYLLDVKTGAWAQFDHRFTMSTLLIPAVKQPLF